MYLCARSGVVNDLQFTLNALTEVLVLRSCLSAADLTGPHCLSAPRNVCHANLPDDLSVTVVCPLGSGCIIQPIIHEYNHFCRCHLRASLFNLLVGLLGLRLVLHDPIDVHEGKPLC